MIILKKFIVHRASHIKLKLITAMVKEDVRDLVKRAAFIRMMQLYECRLFGLCIYRTEECFSQLKKEILDAIPDSAEQSK